MRLLPGGSSLCRCQFERFESRNCQRELRHNQPDAAAVAAGAAAPVAVFVACHTFHFAHFHHFRFSISLWQTIWRSRCRPIGVCNKNFHCCHFAYKMHATSKMHLPAHNFRLWCSATSHQDAGIVVRQDASTAGCHALVFTPLPPRPTPFEPFTLLFHLVIVIFLLLLLLLLLLLQLCGAQRSLFICNSVFFEFVFLILNFAVPAVSPGQVYAS